LVVLEVPEADVVVLATEAAEAAVVEHQEGAEDSVTVDGVEHEVAAVAAAVASQEVDAAVVVVASADVAEEATKRVVRRQSLCQLEWRQRTVVCGLRLPIDSTISLRRRSGVTGGLL
jgi:hypothetical protein